MPVLRGEPVHFGGRTLPSASGPTPSPRVQRNAGRGPAYRPPTPGPGANSIDLHLGGALHRLGQLLNSNNAGISSPAQSRNYPSVTSQLKTLTGYNTLRHPIRAIQHEQAKTPQAKANDAALLHLFSPFSAGKVAARGAAKGLDTSFAAFQGDLSNERFVHGAPVPIRGGIKGFSLRARNPDALLGSGVYTNNIPARPNHFAQMSPSSTKNNAPWQQARFTDEGKARAFAAKQDALGREVRATGGGVQAPLNVPSMWTRRVRVSAHTPESMTGRDILMRTYPTIKGGHKVLGRLGIRPGNDLSFADHYLVEHRPGGAPSMLPLGVKPGTRLFDLDAPIEPGEAARAKQLLIQKLKLSRAAINRDWQDDGAGFGGKEDVKRWSSQLLPENAQAFDDLERLAKLHAAGRNPDTPTARWRSIPAGRDGHLNSVVPTGKHLHRLLDSIMRGVEQPTATAYLDQVPRDQQHILDNPNSVLRQMGYHGLIDPTFNVGGETGKEVVMFDKNRLEPFHDTRQRIDPYVRQSYPVKMAKSLSGVGANFIGAVKQVRSGLMPHMDLPLSDEVNLSIVNLGDGKVRFFVRSAKHPDSVGKELNGAQALHLAHRSLVERKGGRIPNSMVNRAFGSSPQEIAQIPNQADPVDPDSLRALLSVQLPDLDAKGRKLIARRSQNDSGLSARLAENEQEAARLKNTTRTARSLSLDEIVQRMKLRGREVEESPSKRVDQLRHTMNGVPVPNERYLNFDRNESGAPLEALPSPPRAHQFFGHGSLVTYLHGMAPGEKERALADLDKQLAERWHEVRSAHNTAPQVYFPRFPLRKGYPSFGGVAPAEPGGRGRPPYQLGANMEPLQSALNRAQKLGLTGAERTAYVKAYLERRRKG